MTITQLQLVSLNEYGIPEIVNELPYIMGYQYYLNILSNNEYYHKIEFTVGAKSNHPYITKHLTNYSSLNNQQYLKIMSYNIFNYNLQWLNRLKKLGEIIKKNQPDIIGFQEVRLDETQYTSNNHQIQHLKQELSQLGYHNYVFHSAMSYINDIYDVENIFRQEEGLAIFSKYEIIESEYILLSRDLSDPNSHQRICLRALIKADKMINFFVCHFELAQYMITRNAKDLIEYSNQLFDSNITQVICGDFNTEPHSDAIQLLNDEFMDSWNHNDKGYTFSTLDTLRKRIDYIMIKPKSIQVKNHKILGCNNLNYPPASDHCGLIVKINL